MDEQLKAKIKIRGLDFFYGEFHALKNINLNIYEHQVTAFIGPSGCGKSTLLRTLNGIYKLYAHHYAFGKVLLDKRNILTDDQDLNQLRSKVGMVFQKPTPFPMSIFNNIAFGIKLYEKLHEDELAARVEWALRKADLWREVKDKLKQDGLSLSIGQQQRLCIARAIAIKPDVILLDEPTSALDPISTKHIENLVSEIKNDYTIVIVTHNMDQARRISDYTAYMYLGELIESGTTEKIFNTAEKQATQDYIAGKFG